MTFHPTSEWVLFLLPLAALPLVLHWRRRRRATVAFSSIASVAKVPGGLGARLLAVPPILRALAIALLIVAVARPVIANERAQRLVEGVAIQLVVDRSDSMRAIDFSIDGDPANRLDALKDIARKFIAVAYDIPSKCVATYFPEANVLIPVNRYARESKTPISKSVVIKVKKVEET